MNRIRNPFNKRPAHGSDAHAYDENTRPDLSGDHRAALSFTKQSSRSTSPIGAKKEPTEFKMSVVNDSGTYLPPSPPEKKSTWPQMPLKGRTTSNHRCVLNENEQFNMSRESFESYRRSFDISARSPVVPQESFTPRQSIEAARLPPPARSAKTSGSFDVGPTAEEDGFEDVGLDGETSPANKHHHARKKGIFARFGEGASSSEHNNNINNSSGKNSSTDPSRASPGHRGFHIPGRKRGQSGQGAELGNIERPSKAEKGDEVLR